MFANQMTQFVQNVLYVYEGRKVGLVYITPEGVVTSKLVQTTTELAAELSRVMVALRSSHNIYFSVAAYNADATSRDKANVAHCAVLYFDIDKPDFDLVALEAFEKAFGLHPESKYIITTGGGYHVYYLLNKCYDVKSWEQLAHKFYQVAKEFGIPYDPNAKDITRILRMPFTINLKYPNTPVVAMLQTADVTKRSDVSHHVVEYSLTPNIDINDYTYKYDADFDYLRESCSVVRYVISHPDCSYGVWYNVMCNVMHCKDGLKHVHDISSGTMGGVKSYKYNAVDVDRLMAAYVEKRIGPSTCETILAVAEEDEIEQLCKQCSKRYKIKSPVQHPADETLLVPKGFKVDNVVSYETDEDTVAVCSPAVYFTQRLLNERKDEEWLAGFVIQRVGGTKRDILLKPNEMVNPEKLEEALARNGVVVHNRKLMRTYVAAIRTMLLEYPHQMIYTHLGWRCDDKNRPVDFVLGKYKLSKQTERYVHEVPCLFASNLHNRYLKAIKTAGSLPAWKTALTYYNDQKYSMHQFIIGTALAAPLMRFTDYNGFIINIVGESGVGKTTLQRIVNSFFGEPNALLVPISGANSTYNAKVEIFSMLNSICICAEEATAMYNDELSNIFFTFSQGVEKQRADVEGNLRVTRPSWHTLMLMSSNIYLQSKLIGGSGDYAKAMRMLEFELKTPDQLQLVEFKQRVDDVINENYGWAGPEFIKHVLANYAEVEDQLKRNVSELVIKANCTPAERFKVVACAAIITATDIGYKLGLLPWDATYVRDVAIKLLQEKLYALYETARVEITAREIIANLVTQFHDKFCHVTYNPASGEVVEKQPHRENSEIWGRVEYIGDTVNVYILSTKFKQYLYTINMTVPAFLLEVTRDDNIELINEGKSFKVALYKDIVRNSLRGWCRGFKYYVD